MRRFLDFLYQASGYLAGASVLAIFVVMIVSSVMRQTGFKTGGTDDIVSWLCAASAFLAMAHTFKHGDFVRVGLLIDKMSPVWNRRFEVSALLVGTVFVCFLAFAGFRYVYESWQFNDMANGLIVIPLWIPQLSFVLGALLLAVAFLDEMVMVAMGRRPSYVTAVEERHARGDFSEDM
jgi:TRAP-type C4-dicarboxylate transport system permease small subunit